MCRGYHDPASPNEFLDTLGLCSQVSGHAEQEMLRCMLPAALTGSTARWFRLLGQNTEFIDELEASFREECLRTDYTLRFRRELGARIQPLDESLLSVSETCRSSVNSPSTTPRTRNRWNT